MQDVLGKRAGLGLHLQLKRLETSSSGRGNGDAALDKLEYGGRFHLGRRRRHVGNHLASHGSAVLPQGLKCFQREAAVIGDDDGIDLPEFGVHRRHVGRVGKRDLGFGQCDEVDRERVDAGTDVAEESGAVVDSSFRTQEDWSEVRRRRSMRVVGTHEKGLGP